MTLSYLKITSESPLFNGEIRVTSESALLNGEIKVRNVKWERSHFKY